MNKLPQDFIEKYGLPNFDSTFLGIKLRYMSLTDLIAIASYEHMESERVKKEASNAKLKMMGCR